MGCVIIQLIITFSLPYVGYISNGMVDNNLGSDCLVGPKALVHKYCIPKRKLHNLCLKVLTMHGKHI